MYDINFFQKSNNLKNKITHSLLTKKDCADISAEFEIIRSKKPKIYNIETTNYCNMKCVMCPRTIFMERKNIWINDELFDKLTDHIEIYPEEKVEKFFSWVEKDYKQSISEQSENGFYFSVVSRHLVLHGFGEPFLDKNLLKRIELCTQKGIPTYFLTTESILHSKIFLQYYNYPIPQNTSLKELLTLYQNNKKIRNSHGCLVKKWSNHYFEPLDKNIFLEIINN